MHFQCFHQSMWCSCENWSNDVFICLNTLNGFLCCSYFFLIELLYIHRLYFLMYSVITSSLSGSSPHPWMIKTCAYRLHLPIDYIIFRNLSHIVVFFL